MHKRFAPSARFAFIIHHISPKLARILNIMSRSKVTRTCVILRISYAAVYACVIPRNFYALRKCLSIARPTSRHAQNCFLKAFCEREGFFFIKHRAAVHRSTHYESSFIVSSSLSPVYKSTELFEAPPRAFFLAALTRIFKFSLAPFSATVSFNNVLLGLTKTA